MMANGTKILFTRFLTSGYKSTDVDNIHKKINLTKGGPIFFNLARRFLSFFTLGLLSTRFETMHTSN